MNLNNCLHDKAGRLDNGQRGMLQQSGPSYEQPNLKQAKQASAKICNQSGQQTVRQARTANHRQQQIKLRTLSSLAGRG